MLPGQVEAPYSSATKVDRLALGVQSSSFLAVGPGCMQNELQNALEASMRTRKKSIFVHVLTIVFVSTLAELCFFSSAQGQTQGQNAVFNGTGNVVGSSAYVDASTWDGMHSYPRGDVCADIWQAYNYGVASTAPSAVIDARGIPQPSGGFSCTATPWTVATPNITFPSVILLPVGVIPIGTAWTIPARTRIIGEGADASEATGTTLKATSALANGYMLYFGNSSPIFGIGVENLTLDGNAVGNLGGIQSANSQERSYVDHVNLLNISAIGLDVETNGGLGSNSGPYSNITFSASGTSAVCAQIVGLGPTRGIHGLTCTGAGGSDAVGIYLDGNGSSIEDVSVSNFIDGIVVGNNFGSTYARAEGNLILNVTAGSNVTTVVHICGNGLSEQNCPGNSTVTDLSVLQVSRNGATNAIEDDDVPKSSGTPTKVTDNQVAIYAIGEPMNGGFSRFTTASQSADVPSWLVGNGVASGPCSNENGTLYSNTSASGLNLYVCVAGTWTGIM
jgi:hypothetical protein